MAGFQAAVWKWIGDAWREKFPGEDLSVPALSRRTRVALPALYRIEKGIGEASATTIAKLAKGLATTPPGIGKILLVERAPDESPASLLAEAKAVIGRAEQLLLREAEAEAIRKTRAGRGADRRNQPRDEVRPGAESA